MSSSEEGLWTRHGGASANVGTGNGGAWVKLRAASRGGGEDGAEEQALRPGGRIPVRGAGCGGPRWPACQQCRGAASLVQEVGLEGGRQWQCVDVTQTLLAQGQAHRAAAEIHERQGLGWGRGGESEDTLAQLWKALERTALTRTAIVAVLASVDD